SLLAISRPRRGCALRDRVLVEAAGGIRRPGRAQRTSRSPVAEYAQRLICGPSWRRGARPAPRCRRPHGFRLPYRPCRGAAGLESEAGGAGDWHGRDPLQPRARHHPRRGRPAGEPAFASSLTTPGEAALGLRTTMGAALLAIAGGKPGPQ